MSDILRTALACICRRLNDHLQAIERRSDDWVVMSNLATPNKSAPDGVTDKLVMAIHGFDHRTTMDAMPAVRPRANPTGSYAIVPPSLFLDVRLAIVANFQGRAYPDGLAALSRLIAFFQTKPFFTEADTIDLDPQIERLAFEFETLTIAETDHVIRMLGIPYLPTAFYRMRALPFTSGSDREIAHARGLAQPVPID